MQPTSILTPLSLPERKTLILVARAALACALAGQEADALDSSAYSAALHAPSAVFVTLTLQGRLRGCIGNLEAELPLVQAVQRYVVAAGFEDYRFPPLTAGELPDVEIEISRLTEPQTLAYSDAQELVQKLRPGIDGIVLRSGVGKATFLPQVWDKAPQPEQFLGLLCQKMGFPAEAWKSSRFDVFRYEVEKFHERELPAVPGLELCETLDV